MERDSSRVECERLGDARGRRAQERSRRGWQVLWVVLLSLVWRGALNVGEQASGGWTRDDFSEA